MSNRFPGQGSRIARLRHLLPAWALVAAAALTSHPAALILLLLSLPLFAAAMTLQLSTHAHARYARLLRRGGLAYLLLTLALMLFAGACVGWPALRLLNAAEAGNAAWLSIGLALLLLVLLRVWALFGWVWLKDEAEPENSGSIGRLRAAVNAALPLTRGLFQGFGSGLAVAIALALLVLSALFIAGVPTAWPPDLRLAALGTWALVIAPLATWILLWRCAALMAQEATPTARPPVDGADARPVGGGLATREGVLVREGASLDRAIDPYPLGDPISLAAGVLAAAAAGEVPRALDLLRQGADPAAMPALDARDQRSLPIIAATLPDLRLLREIIVRGGALNRAVGGLTPLLAATRDSLQGRVDAVMTLLTNGADPRIADAGGNTPLHHAARCSDPALAAMLLDAGAVRDALNGEGHSPLAIAAQAQNELVLRCLLERGAVADPARGQPALVAAVSGPADLAAPIKLLLKRKAKVDARDVLGRSALHAAALNGHSECVDALLAAGAVLDARDQGGVTPLMEAARAGQDAVLVRLIARKPSANLLDGGGRSALVIACQSRRATPESVRLLLAAGVDPELATREGKRALDFAVNAGRWREVALLDPGYPIPANVRDHVHDDADGDQSSMDAGGHDTTSPARNPDRIALLAQSLAQRRHAMAAELIALSPPLDREALTAALLASAARIDATGYALLVAAGVDPSAVGHDGRALLHQLAAIRPLPWVALRALATSTVSPAGGGALADLLAGATASEGAHRALAIRLAHDWLARGADAARGGRITQSSPLQIAVRMGAVSLVRDLLERGVSVRHQDAQGRTLLHALARVDDSEAAVAIAQCLLRAGVDPRTRDTQGQTAQGAALARGRTVLANWLHWPLWQPPARALRDADLASAAALGDRAAVQRLLELGMSIDARDAQGCTALIRAAGGGHAELATVLLARGADADARANSGITALGAALNAGRIGLLDRLLEQGIAVDQRLVDDSTPLMLAAALGRVDGVARLLAYRADVQARDALGNSALHAAAQFSYTSSDPDSARALLGQLLDAGAEVDARNEQGQTPLLVLLGARVTVQTPPGSRALAEFASLLVAAGASLDAQDTRGVGVLHAAAMHGLLDTVRWLVRAGADARLRDTLGRTAHDVALVLGLVDVAAELKRS